MRALLVQHRQRLLYKKVLFMTRVVFSAIFTFLGCLLLLADSEDFTKIDQTTCRKQQALRVLYRYTTNCPGAATQPTGSFTLDLPESLDIGLTESNARQLAQQARLGGLLTSRWFLRWHMVCRSRIPTVSVPPSDEAQPESSILDEPFYDEPSSLDGGNEEIPPDTRTTLSVYLDQGVPLPFLTRQSIPSLASLEHIQFLFVEEENKIQKDVKEIACPSDLPTAASETISGTMMKKEYRLICQIYNSLPLEDCSKSQPNCKGTRLPNNACELVLIADIK